MTDLAAFDARIDELASRADVGALKEVLADDFVYMHSTGNRQDRTEWLESLVPLAGKRDRVVSNVEVDLHGNIAVVTGDLDISTIMNGGPLKITAEEAFPVDLTLSKTYDRFFDGVDFSSFSEDDVNANIMAVLELETRVAFGTRVSAE